MTGPFLHKFTVLSRLQRTRLLSDSAFYCDLLTAAGRAYPERKAITSRNTSLTYRELGSLSHELANRFAHSGRIALLLPFSSADFAVSVHAASMTHTCFLPLDPSHPPSLLQYFLSDFNADTVLTNEDTSYLFRKLSSENVKYRCIRVDCDGRSDVTATTLKPECPQSTELLVMYTSGTTGKPKGVLHTQASIGSQVLAMKNVWQWSVSDSILQVLPLHHTHGLVNCLMTSMAVGAHCVLASQKHFDAQQIFNKLTSESTDSPISVFMAVPTIYSKLVNHYENERYKEGERDKIRNIFAKRMRIMVSGSASLPDSVYHKMNEITGMHLIEQYGSSETGRCLSMRPQVTASLATPGYVGQPMPNIDLILHKEEQQDSTLSADRGVIQGEIRVRGPGIFREYIGKLDATNKAFDKNGYFKTGDIACYDDETKNYKILGRASIDVIKSGGYKVSALEVERVLSDHPAIAECAVVGTEDVAWGQLVTAVLVFKRENEIAKLADIRKFCSERLPKYSCPRSIVIRREPFERNAVGKIDKKTLKAKLEMANKTVQS